MICVLAKIDDRSTEKLNSFLRDVFPDDCDAGRIYGHITLASFEGDDEDGFIAKCSEILNGVPSFRVFYERLEVLEETSIIVASPADSSMLYRLHGMIAEVYGDHLDKWTGTPLWYPHTTLYYGPGTDLHDICRMMSEKFHPISADICRIDFSRVIGNSYDITDSIRLIPFTD